MRNSLAHGTNSRTFKNGEAKSVVIGRASSKKSVADSLFKTEQRK